MGDISTRPYSLAYLELLLNGLPDTLPFRSEDDSTYKFHRFWLDDDDVKDLEIPGAANRQLECRLGPRTARNDTYILKERGPGLTPLVRVLKQYTGKFPDNILLQKWVADSCRAAENAYEDANVPVCGLYCNSFVHVFS